MAQGVPTASAPFLRRQKHSAACCSSPLPVCVHLAQLLLRTLFRFRASDGVIHYCDEEPRETVLRNFRRRKDCQIMGLELLSIAYGKEHVCVSPLAQPLYVLYAGLSTFDEFIRGF